MATASGLIRPINCAGKEISRWRTSWTRWFVEGRPVAMRAVRRWPCVLCAGGLRAFTRGGEEGRRGEARGGEEGRRGEARGHGHSPGGCRWPRRRRTAAALTLFRRSARSARSKSGPDRQIFGPQFRNRTVQFIRRARTERAKTERATSRAKSPLGTSRLIEAYRTLRDRGPYPADQVVKDLSGSFAFVVFDNGGRSVFAAQSTDGGVPLHWGVAADGSVVICDDRAVAKAGCGKSYAPFPPGCMFHSEGGLKSFEHPMNRLKAFPRVDSEGVMCGANFKVDAFTKINSMPRVGSATNWAATWDDAAI